MNKKEAEAKIKEIKQAITYEKRTGIHTYHLCACGKYPCRSIKCIKCWEEELKKHELLFNLFFGEYEKS